MILSILVTTLNMIVIFLVKITWYMLEGQNIR